jgi:hypothetical protein
MAIGCLQEIVCLRHVDDICAEPMSDGHTKTLYIRHSMDELRELIEKLEKRGSVVADWVLSARAMLARIVKKKGGLKRASLQVADDDVYAKVCNMHGAAVGAWHVCGGLGGLADNRPSPPPQRIKAEDGQRDSPRHSEEDLRGSTSPDDSPRPLAAHAGDSDKPDAAALGNRPTDAELRKLLADADSDAFFSDEYLEIKEVCATLRGVGTEHTAMTRASFVFVLVLMYCALHCAVLCSAGE